MKGNNHNVKEKLYKEFGGQSSEKAKLLHFKYVA